MNNERLIQITSGKGPAECELAVALALREFLRECRQAGIHTEILHEAKGDMERTLRSVTVSIKGAAAAALADSWKGVVQWTCRSPYRRLHPRKNWFIAVNAIEPLGRFSFSEQDVEYNTMRASGAGGQHVNKTNSAVRAKHLPSGMAVTCMESRSQLQNKKLALQKLRERVHQWELGKMLEQSAAAWLNHHHLERGKPRRMYEGSGFSLKSKNRQADRHICPGRTQHMQVDTT